MAPAAVVEDGERVLELRRDEDVRDGIEDGQALGAVGAPIEQVDRLAIVQSRCFRRLDKARTWAILFMEPYQ